MLTCFFTIGIPLLISDEEFEVLVIPGHSDVPEQKKKERFVRLVGCFFFAWKTVLHYFYFNIMSNRVKTYH